MKPFFLINMMLKELESVEKNICQRVSLWARAKKPFWIFVDLNIAIFVKFQLDFIIIWP